MKTNKKIPILIMFLLLCIIGGSFTLYTYNQNQSISKTETKKKSKTNKKVESIQEKKNKEEQVIENNTIENEINNNEQVVVENQETNITNESNNSTNKVMLNVPTRVQETSYYCGPASLQMVLNYKGISVSQSELAVQLNTHPVTGTEYVDLQRVANHYLFGKDSVGANESGYHIQTLNRYDTDSQIAIDFARRLKTDISTNDPIFAAIDIHTIYPEYANGNHMVVVNGYTINSENNIDSIYFMDPSYRVQDATYGGLKKVDFNHFISAIINNDEPAYIY